MDVYKPTTNQVMPLPNPDYRYKTHKVAIVVFGGSPIYFKIFRFSWMSCLSEHAVDNEDKLHFEVFESDTWSWHAVSNVNYCRFADRTYVDDRQESVTAGATVYMLLMSGHIFMIDARSEEISLIDLPTPQHPSDAHIVYGSTILTKHKGQLAVDCLRPNGVWDRWVRARNGSWVQLDDRNDNEVAKDSWDYEYVERVPDPNDIYSNIRRTKHSFYKVTDSMTTFCARKKTIQVFPFRSDFELLILPPQHF